MASESCLEDIDRMTRKIKKIRPLSQTLSDRIREYCRVKLTYTSNALEGNALTESETRVVLKEGVTVGGKLVRDHLEVLGHSDAYDYLCSLSFRRQIESLDILELHRLFYHRLDLENSGKYRRIKGGVSGSDATFPLPNQIPEMMEKLMCVMPEIKSQNHPVHSAAILHKELLAIFPFVDGNGRISRLAMNLSLIQDGFPIAIISPTRRVAYFECLRESDYGNITPFLNFISQVVYESQKNYLRLIEELDL